MRHTYGVFMLVATALAAQAQVSPADALRTPVKTVKAADLPDGLRAVSIGSDTLGGVSPYLFMGMGSGGTEDPRTSLTIQLLGTTFVDPDEFAALLEGKRARIRGYVMDVASMMTNSPHDRSGPPEPTFTETYLEAGRILQWSPRPTLTKEAILAVYNGPKAATPAVKAAALSGAKQVSLAILMYSADYDDTLPFADSTARAQTAIYPYAKNNDIWKSPNPEGGRLLYNTTLSKADMQRIESPSETPLVWDEKPWPDGGRVVGYVDGHVNYATREGWERVIWPYELRRRSHAPTRGRAPRSSCPEASR